MLNKDLISSRLRHLPKNFISSWVYCTLDKRPNWNAKTYDSAAIVLNQKVLTIYGKKYKYKGRHLQIWKRGREQTPGHVVNIMVADIIDYIFAPLPAFANRMKAVMCPPRFHSKLVERLQHKAKPKEQEFLNRGAHFSEDRKYRYLMWRQWKKQKPMIGFIGICPYSSDDVFDSALFKNVMLRLKEKDYGGVLVGNVFPYRAGGIAKLEAAYAAGVDIEDTQENEKYLLQIIKRCEEVLICWGVHAKYHWAIRRQAELLEKIIAPNENNTKFLQIYHPNGDVGRSMSFSPRMLQLEEFPITRAMIATKKHYRNFIIR